MRNSLLNLNGKTAFLLLSNWINKIERIEKDLEIQIDDNYSSGEGKTIVDKSNSSYQIIIGCDISNRFPLKYLFINDRDFIKTGVTLFHEINHYQEHIKEHTKECLLSELSKYKNRNYYRKSWHELPHEIHAEYNGVMTMWDVMEDKFTSEQTDYCMLDYINTKANQTRYMSRQVQKDINQRKK